MLWHTFVLMLFEMKRSKREQTTNFCINFVKLIQNERVPLGLVDVCAAFAQIEFSLWQRSDTIEAKKGGVLMLIPQAALVASENGFDVEPVF